MKTDISNKCIQLQVAQAGNRTVCTAVNGGNTVKITFWDPPRVIGGAKLGNHSACVSLNHENVIHLI